MAMLSRIIRHRVRGLYPRLYRHLITLNHSRMECGWVMPLAGMDAMLPQQTRAHGKLGPW